MTKIYCPTDAYPLLHLMHSHYCCFYCKKCWNLVDGDLIHNGITNKGLPIPKFKSPKSNIPSLEELLIE